jgi:hypothetical protein
MDNVIDLRSELHKRVKAAKATEAQVNTMLYILRIRQMAIHFNWPIPQEVKQYIGTRYKL